MKELNKDSLYYGQDSHQALPRTACTNILSLSECSQKQVYFKSPNFSNIIKAMVLESWQVYLSYKLNFHYASNTVFLIGLF
jgi:hypothetical protein